MVLMDNTLIWRILSGLFYGYFTRLTATVDGASGRNRPYYMPIDWYAAIGRQEVIYIV